MIKLTPAVLMVKPDKGIFINAYALNSAQMKLEGWDIPEAAYVASLCLLRKTTLPKKSKGWHIRSSGCHRFCSKGSPPCKISRPSVSGENGSALKSSCGANLTGVIPYFPSVKSAFQDVLFVLLP